MSSRRVRAGLAVGASLGALVFAGAASAATVRGVVVAHNSRAHGFVVARRSGKLVSVHSRRSPSLGRVVTVRARELRNGTFAARHITAGRQVRRRVLIHGVVTFVNRRRGEFTVSAGGASLLVHRRHAAGRAADVSSGTSMPSVGDEVTVTTQIDDQGDLEDQGVQQTGTETQNIDIEGTILSIDNTPGSTVDGTATSGTLTISADGEDDTTQSITVAVPSTMDISTFQVGQEVELTVSTLSDGSFLLQGSSEDGNSSQADNPGDQQGCQGDGESGSSTCGQSGGDGSGSMGGDGSGSSQGGDGSSSSGSL
jgi:uncharacterized membrane protein YgcG